MGDKIDIKEQSQENNQIIKETIFDKLKKEPNNKDKTDIIDNIQIQKNEIINNPDFVDIKDNISTMIDNLLQEKIISLDTLSKNLKIVFETIFSDPLYTIDPNQKGIDSKDIFMFREKFTNLENQENKSEIVTRKSEAYKSLMNMYEGINNTVKIQESELENYAKTISTITNKDEFKDLSEEEQNNYLRARYASEQIAKESQASEKKTISQANYEFITQFNKLDTDLGIGSPIDLTGLTIETASTEKKIDKPKDEEETTAKTMADIVNNDNLGAELLDNNTDVQDFVLDTETNTVDQKKIEKNVDVQIVVEDKLGIRYEADIHSAIQQLLAKNKLEIYKDKFDIGGKLIDTDDIPSKDQKKLEKISDKIIETFTAKAEEKIAEDTNKVIKTKAVAALLQNIGQYFQIDNFAKDFTIDLESGIAFDEKELKLSGSMEGKDMTFYYDMDSGEIWANDFVHHNPEDKTFYIDKKEGTKGREKLPLKMTTLETTLKDSESKYMGEIGSALDNIENIDDYESKLSETSFTIDKKSDIADIVIEHAMAKNIAIQETHDFLEDYIPPNNTYSKDKEIWEYKLYKIIDTSMDRYTTDEIKTRRKTLGEFNTKISQKDPIFPDKMIKGMFNQETRYEDTNGKYNIAKGPNIYQFINAITYDQLGTTKNEVIDLDFFGKIVEKLKDNVETTADITTKPAKYEKLLADRETSQSAELADKIDFDKAYDNTSA